MQAVKIQISLHKQTDQNLGCLKWLFFKQSLDIAVYIKEQEAKIRLHGNSMYLVFHLLKSNKRSTYQGQ